MNAKLFVSHAVADRPLVEAFVELLESGVGVLHRQIFCSSLDGQSIKPGKHFVESIREQLDGAGCVVALISEAFYASQFCLCELGGVWIQTKELLPIVVPPLGFGSLKAVLLGMQALRLNDDAHLDVMRDEIAERLQIQPHDTPTWNSRKARFLKQLPGILGALPPTAAVPREEYTKIAASLDEYRKEFETKEQEIEDLREEIEELKKVKDAEGVANVIAKRMNFEEEFDGLVRAASEALDELPRVVREAIYYCSSGKPYLPKRDDWDEVDDAVEEGQLEEIETDEGGRTVQVDRRSGKARAALKAVERLGEWMEGASSEFSEWYRVRYKEVPDLQRRPFWRTHLA